MAINYSVNAWLGAELNQCAIIGKNSINTSL